MKKNSKKLKTRIVSYIPKTTASNENLIEENKFEEVAKVFFFYFKC